VPRPPRRTVEHGTTMRSEARWLRLSGERIRTGRRLSISAQCSSPRRIIARAAVESVASDRSRARGACVSKRR
jgi:hypothetical protein